MHDETRVIEEAVKASLHGETLSRVLVVPTVDSEGKDALDVTLVLSDADLSGTAALGLLVRIQGALTAAGDERFPIITVTTESELALDGGPES